MAIEVLTLKEIINPTFDKGAIYGKIRNTCSEGLSKTEQWDSVSRFKWEKINNTNKYMLTFIIGGYGPCTIEVEMDEEIDFVQQIGNPDREYKIVRIYYNPKP